MKLSVHLILFMLTIVASFLVSILGVYITLSVANLYSLSFITSFSFAQIYGAWIIIGILSHKYKKSETSEIPYKDAFERLSNQALFYLIAWGLAFLIFPILN